MQEVFSQNITLKEKNASLEKVFKEIRRQSGFNIVYTKQMLEGTSKVTIDLKNVSSEAALDECLKDQPLTYSVVNNTVVIKPKEIAVPKEIIESEAPPIKVGGRIVNGNGEPLIGASIVINRTKKGTQTNAKGEFILYDVDPEDVVTVTFTGYTKQVVKISAEAQLNIMLELATNELDEAIVQAYGTTTRRLGTGNIAKVTAAEIERQPVMNPMLALQGKVAGLDIKQTNGFATAPLKVELRGRNTIGVNSNQTFLSDPLYVINGVPLTTNEIGGSSNYTSGSTGFFQNGFDGPAGGMSPLFFINPADIESIEVLKDADATAIYGSRGANGAILITTKKEELAKRN